MHGLRRAAGLPVEVADQQRGGVHHEAVARRIAARIEPGGQGVYLVRGEQAVVEALLPFRGIGIRLPVERDRAQQLDVQRLAQTQHGRRGPKVKAGGHAGDKARVAEQGCFAHRMVERGFERADAVGIVRAERHFFDPVSGKATGFAALVRHGHPSNQNKCSISVSIHPLRAKRKL